MTYLEFNVVNKNVLLLLTLIKTLCIFRLTGILMESVLFQNISLRVPKILSFHRRVLNEVLDTLYTNFLEINTKFMEVNLLTRAGYFANK